MNINSIFRQGSEHKVCQDYARHTDTLALLSDGCSGSPDTDIGARHIILEMLRLLSYPNTRFEQDSVNYLIELSALCANEKLVNSGMPKRCTDATLGGIFVDGALAKIFLYGDGYIISKEKDSSAFFVEKFQFTTKIGSLVYETPIYPIYKYETKDPSFYTERTYDSFFIKESELMENSGELFIAEAQQRCEYKEYDISKYDLLAVASDGLGTFKNDIPIVVHELFDIKAKKGVYLERHYSSYIRTYNERHTDDLSIVCLVS